MAGIEAGIYLTLTTAHDITDLVSTRVYPQQAPQGVTFPCIVYQRISGAPAQTLQGPSGLKQMRIQIDCFSKTTYENAKAIARAVEDALDNHSGSGSGWEILASTLLDERDGSNAALKLFAVQLDFRISYTED